MLIIFFWSGVYKQSLESRFNKYTGQGFAELYSMPKFPSSCSLLWGWQADDWDNTDRASESSSSGSAFLPLATGLKMFFSSEVQWMSHLAIRWAVCPQRELCQSPKWACNRALCDTIVGSRCDCTLVQAHRMHIPRSTSWYKLCTLDKMGQCRLMSSIKCTTLLWSSECREVMHV